MNEANTKYLFENFSFFHPEKPLTESLMAFGFDCGDGWFEIVNKLCEDLQALKMPDFEVISVKEKSGTLRISARNIPAEYNNSVSYLIQEAEKRSESTCEVCGKPGTLRRHYRLPHIAFVICDDCSSYGKY